jgi:hypothetical protein
MLRKERIYNHKIPQFKATKGACFSSTYNNKITKGSKRVKDKIGTKNKGTNRKQ